VAIAMYLPALPKGCASKSSKIAYNSVSLQLMPDDGQLCEPNKYPI